MKDGGERLTGQIEVTKGNTEAYVVNVILLYSTNLFPCSNLAYCHFACCFAQLWL